MIREWTLICVECDDANCGLRGPITSTSRDRALELARLAGWETQPDSDTYCPTHKRNATPSDLLT